MMERFSDREGYRPSAPRITVREDAPYNLRRAIPWIAEQMGRQPYTIRMVTCGVLQIPPRQENRDAPDIRQEVDWLMDEAPWPEVYDIAEALCDEFVEVYGPDGGDEFEGRLNDFFVRHGIGWEFRDGRITHRGSEVFAKSTHEIPDRLDESGFPQAAKQMRKALTDISRRPKPDTTGAISRAMGALETTAGKITGPPRSTMGALVRDLDLPAPVDGAVHKLWGYASNRARHISEQQEEDPGVAEAELIVAVAGALCEFLAQRGPVRTMPFGPTTERGRQSSLPSHRD